MALDQNYKIRKYQIGFLLYLFIGFFVLSFILIKCTKKQGKKDWDLFYPTEINGHIESVSPAGKVVVKFEINSIDTTFYFNPNYAIINGIHYNFLRVAHIGDSLYKPPYGDTIKLITNDREYPFTFKGHKHNE